MAGGRRASAAGGAAKPLPEVLHEPPAAPSSTVDDDELALPALARDVDSELPWSESTTGVAGDGFATAIAQDGVAEIDPDDDADLPDWSPSSATVPWGSAASLSGSPTPAYLPRPAARRPSAKPAPAVVDGGAEQVAGPDAVGGAAAVAVAAAAYPAAATVPAAAVPAAAVPTAGVSPTPVPPASRPVGAFAGPGAYVPPLQFGVPAGPPAPAREWAGHTGDPDDAVEDRGRGPAVGLDADTRVRLLDFARWLSVAGSAFAAVGFLLPWGLVVIGSTDTGYFGRWGFAGPWHVVVALAILGNLGLALIENPLPVWLRTGVFGLGLGALLLGLVWPYVTLPALGTGPGALIVGVGAAALAVSGILALVADRHAEAPTPV